ncbi:sprT-like domain-containing protein Spartan [Selaginella moellendorffii]|uniref:sprT-like domain-containing protein Spartan n=1 Tax=Selaginella moellendorffii TaxID=88036 RepID=UPI000D1C863A|nr:sprT-like domain-containing protein Spartan [Selaginella moellendorffii]|eukprot:XP_024527705.1 sprT-like domain-containing protein Spartan [Selaginella moellendorffii]
MTKKSQRLPPRSGAKALGAGKIAYSRPDVHRLFGHYNDLYFASELAGCSVEWSSRRTSEAGECFYGPGRCQIRLSEPILKSRSLGEVKSTLLHEMIHAHLFVTKENANHNDHGDLFRMKVDQIKESQLQDEERPEDGYGIRLQHSFLEGSCSESRECEDVQEFLPDATVSARVIKTKKSGESSDLLTKDVKEPPTESFKRTNNSVDKHVSFKIPRLDSFFGKSRGLEKKGKLRKASLVPKDTRILQNVQTAGKPMPDVIIGWKNWCASEPEEEEERLIDRRRERRLLENARISEKLHQTGSSKQSTHEMVDPGMHARSNSNQADETVYQDRISSGGLELEACRDRVSSGGLELEVYQGDMEMVDLKLETSREIVSPGSLVVFQGRMERGEPSHGYRDDPGTSLIDLDPEQGDHSRALVVAPLKVYERRRDRERKKKAQLERERRTVESKAPVTLSTFCPICSQVFSFDTTKPEDNAKFNTHIDLCLNGRAL